MNAIIFLLHKPIGLGKKRNIITKDNKKFQEFIKFIGNLNYDDNTYKIGFDSCTVPAILENPGNVNLDSLDTCEAARWSAYVTSDMKLLPCSFDNQKQNWAIDLRKYTIQEAWNSRIFDEFRNIFRDSCPRCKKKHLCLGGCPICPEIVLCKEKYI